MFLFRYFCGYLQAQMGRGYLMQIIHSKIEDSCVHEDVEISSSVFDREVQDKGNLVPLFGREHHFIVIRFWQKQGRGFDDIYKSVVAITDAATRENQIQKPIQVLGFSAIAMAPDKGNVSFPFAAKLYEICVNFYLENECLHERIYGEIVELIKEWPGETEE